MSVAAQVFFILLVSGLLLVGAEVFVPGGVLGALGGAALLGAVGAAFKAFPDYGGIIAAAIVFLMGLAIYLWIKIFPRTRLGKAMTVSASLADSKAADPKLASLASRTGEAVSDLRPSGYAMIDGKRVDVISSGEHINKGERVSVLRVEGNRVFVRRVEAREAAATSPGGISSKQQKQQ